MLSQEEKIILVKEGHANPLFFAKTFLEHLFPGRIPWVHKGLWAILIGRCQFLAEEREDPDLGCSREELCKIIDNFVWLDGEGEERQIFHMEEGILRMELGRFTLLMFPRGFSKTTIAGVAMPVYSTVYKERIFSMYVSESAGHAGMQITNVRRELAENPLIVEVFGNLKPSLSDEQKWSGPFFETTTGVAMAARGRGGQIRGALHMGTRPQHIIIDDIEDEESVETEVQREKTKDWAYKALLPALPRLDPNAGLVAMGTLLHKSSLLMTWADDPQFNVIRFGLQDKDGDYLWPENIDEPGDKQLKESYARAGRLPAYYMEYRNELHLGEDQIFHIEKILHEALPEGSTWRAAIYCDPAFSRNRSSDYTAITVVAMASNGVHYIREAFIERVTQRKLIDTYFELQAKYACIFAGVEANAAQAGLVETMREEMFRKHQYFEITPVTHKSAKISRIMNVLPGRYHSGYIRHTQKFPRLELQLDEFRDDDSHEHDDGPDALAACIVLLDPMAAQAAGVDPTEDQYEPIAKVMGGADWGYG